MQNLREEFAGKVLEWKDVPYLHRGINRAGCDCTGIIIGVLQEMGFMQGYQLREYPPDWNLHAAAGNFIEEEMLKIANEIPKRETLKGDILLIRIGKCLSHSGISMGESMMLHAHSSAAKFEYATLRASRWGKRWEKTYRLSSTKLTQGRKK